MHLLVLLWASSSLTITDFYTQQTEEVGVQATSVSATSEPTHIFSHNAELMMMKLILLVNFITHTRADSSIQKEILSIVRFLSSAPSHDRAVDDAGHLFVIIKYTAAYKALALINDP